MWFNVLMRIYTDLRRSRTPPKIPKPVPDDISEALACVQLPQKWTDQVVKPMGGVQFEEWENQFLLCKHKEAIIATMPDGSFVAYVPGILDPFKLIGSQFLILPDLPEFRPRNNAPAQPQVCLPEASPSVSHVPSPSALTATHSPQKKQRIISHGDVLDVLNDYLFDNYIQKIDLNRKGVEIKRELQVGKIREIKSDAGEVFFSSLSKSDRTRINQALPYGRHSFRQLVDKVAEASLGNGDRLGIGIYLAAKLILSRSQFLPSLEQGEIFVTRNSLLLI